MKKCFIHTQDDAAAQCTRCGRNICTSCLNAAGAVCPHCLCEEVNPAYAQNAKKIQRLKTERNIYLAAASLSIVLVVISIFVQAMRPYFYVFFALSAVPLLPYTIPSAYKNIYAFMAAEGQGASQKAISILGTVLFAAALLGGGLVSSMSFIVLRTFSIRLSLTLNHMILAQYLSTKLQHPSQSDYLYIK